MTNSLSQYTSSRKTALIAQSLYLHSKKEELDSMWMMSPSTYIDILIRERRCIMSVEISEGDMKILRAMKLVPPKYL
jgi:hypothetical protein